MKVFDMEGLINAQDVACTLGVSRSSAYKIIRNLNRELQEQGYLIVSGKVPKRYFRKRYYLLPSESD